jgi:hypothetical protein
VLELWAAFEQQEPAVPQDLGKQLPRSFVGELCQGTRSSMDGVELLPLLPQSLGAAMKDG